MASIIPGIYVKSYETAILVCLVVAVLNATIGFFIRLPLNILTLFLITFLVRLFVSALLFKLADKLLDGFKVRSWTIAFVLALSIAIASSAIDKVL